MSGRSKRFGGGLDLEHGLVELAHGSGGRATAQLIDELFLPAFDNPLLRALDDQARFDVAAGRMVISTDSHVVTPLFFAGGDIGSLAVHGTLNDVAMSGARPRYLTAGFILEEGLPLRDLARIVASMAAAADAAGVPVVTGDTKVVERGKADGCFITTTGVGTLGDGVEIAASRARPGDRILLSGSLGDHGIAILAGRERLDFASGIVSDSAALHGLVADLLATGAPLHCLRDPTRGGLAATLNELAQSSGVGMRIDEAALPVHEAVRACCEFLGLDPLHVANEGKLVAIVPPESAAPLLAAMRAHPLGREAAEIGEVLEDPDGFVQLRTAFGGERLIDWLGSDPLPRIC